MIEREATVKISSDLLANLLGDQGANGRLVRIAPEGYYEVTLALQAEATRRSCPSLPPPSSRRAGARGPADRGRALGAGAPGGASMARTLKVAIAGWDRWPVGRARRSADAGAEAGGRRDPSPLHAGKDVGAVLGLPRKLKVKVEGDPDRFFRKVRPTSLSCAPRPAQGRQAPDRRPHRPPRQRPDALRELVWRCRPGRPPSRSWTVSRRGRRCPSSPPGQPGLRHGRPRPRPDRSVPPRAAGLRHPRRRRGDAQAAAAAARGAGSTSAVPEGGHEGTVRTWASSSRRT